MRAKAFFIYSGDARDPAAGGVEAYGAVEVTRLIRNL